MQTGMREKTRTNNTEKWQWKLIEIKPITTYISLYIHISKLDF